MEGVAQRESKLCVHRAMASVPYRQNDLLLNVLDIMYMICASWLLPPSRVFY